MTAKQGLLKLKSALAHPWLRRYYSLSKESFLLTKSRNFSGSSSELVDRKQLVSHIHTNENFCETDNHVSESFV